MGQGTYLKEGSSQEITYRNPPFSYFITKAEDGCTYDFKMKIGDKTLTKRLKRLFRLEKQSIINSLLARELDLKAIVKKTRDYLYRKIRRNFNTNRKIKGLNKALRYFGYKIVGLSIYPLLCDPQVDEIFIDGPGVPIYIDHQRGRLKTNLQLSRNEATRLTNLIKINGDAIITASSPSAKVELVSKDFRIRISLDSSPLVSKEVAFDIRKLKRRPPDPSLFATSKEKANLLALILFSAAIRANIVIVGEPASGKTTLLSVIIKTLPSYWRIITIEDVKEFPNFPKKRNLRINVDPFEREIKKRRKKEEIIKLLHKSPDYAILSEIQSQKDNEALYHTVAAGIPVAATLHARDLSELINRWTSVFGFDAKRVRNIDLVVLTRRNITPRSIFRGIDRVYLVADETLLDSVSSFQKRRVKTYEERQFLRLDPINSTSSSPPLTDKKALKLICTKVSTVHMDEIQADDLTNLRFLFNLLKAKLGGEVEDPNLNKEDQKASLTEINEEIHTYVS